MQFESIQHFQSVFAYNHFVSQADTNYILAKISALAGYHGEFYWNAAQSLEKYMKACLVLNGHKVDRFGHKIFDGYKIIEENFEEFIKFKSDYIEELSEIISVRDYKYYISKIDNMGHPDVRYGMISYNFGTDDFVIFCYLSQLIRSLSIGLDWKIGQYFPESDPGADGYETYGDLLRNNPLYQIREFYFPQKSYFPKFDNINQIRDYMDVTYTDVNDILSTKVPNTVNCEIPFFRNSFLNLLFHHIGKSPDDYLAREGAEWMLNNIYLDRESKKVFRLLLDDPQYYSVEILSSAGE
ncbi:MAG: HEPN domain-containing protein [Alphaproteobacteria bacterium]|nr:HEPN domain-containing protein [Alphaproteobacteria bacterium SS10]